MTQKSKPIATLNNLTVQPRKYNTSMIRASDGQISNKISLSNIKSFSRFKSFSQISNPVFPQISDLLVTNLKSLLLVLNSTYFVYWFFTSETTWHVYSRSVITVSYCSTV